MKHESDFATPRGIVMALAPGRYTLKEMYGPDWENVRRPRACGQWFRAAVDGFYVSGVRLVGKRSNRSLEYEVKATGPQCIEAPPVGPTSKIADCSSWVPAEREMTLPERPSSLPPWS